jgi:hypothetical protein
MNNKFYSILDLHKTFIFFLIFFFSLFFFRGRLGSDDLEVYNFVLAFKNSPLNFVDFIYFLKENYTSTKLNSEFFFDKNQLPDYKTWNQRFIWVFQTYLITTLINFLPFKIETLKFLSMYSSGFIISFYACLSFYLSYSFFRKMISNFESLFLTVIIFFGTGIIAFFSGAYIESLIILLIVIRFNIENKKINIFFIDLVILLIKPYYFLILLPLYLTNLSKKNILDKVTIPFILFVSIFSIRQSPLFNASLSNFTKNEYANFSLDVFKILSNLFDQYFSFGIGIFITSFIPIIFIIYGFKKNDTIYKVIFFFFFTLFLSFFEGNHGQVPGGRYILPCFFIFLKEFAVGFKKIKEKYFFLFFFIFIFTILNLPTLEYRNFSLPHYKTNSSISGKAAQMENKNGFVVKGTLFDYPLRNLFFNHTLFANKILFAKIYNNPIINFGDIIVDTAAVYPMTAPARVLYILENQKTIFIKTMPLFIIKSKVAIKFLYYTTIVFFLLIFSISFIKSYISFKNDNF